MSRKTKEQMKKEVEEELRKRMEAALKKMEENKCPNCGNLFGLMKVICYGLNGPAEVCHACGFAKQGNEVVNPGMPRRSCF